MARSTGIDTWSYGELHWDAAYMHSLLGRYRYILAQCMAPSTVGRWQSYGRYGF